MFGFVLLPVLRVVALVAPKVASNTDRKIDLPSASWYSRVREDCMETRPKERLRHLKTRISYVPVNVEFQGHGK
jgi:hypothetical protein